MELSKYYQLLKENEDKIPVIEQVMKFHPGMGTELGWSWYTGGMRDTGEWKVEVLLTIPTHQLQAQIDKWNAEWEHTKKQAQEWAAKTLEEQGVITKKTLEDMNRDFQNRLMWGT